jgi:hypothetical protein
LRVGWWGDARLRVAQFLANLWQGPCRAVHGMSVGTFARQSRPEATGTSGTLLSSDDFGSSVEGGGGRHSVMAARAQTVQHVLLAPIAVPGQRLGVSWLETRHAVQCCAAGAGGPLPEPGLPRRGRPPDPARPLSPHRVRRGFRHIRHQLGLPARGPKPARPGPGRPKGRCSGPARRYPVAKQTDKADNPMEPKAPNRLNHKLKACAGCWRR